VTESGRGWWLWRADRRRFSPLLLRILAVNVLALAILLVSLLYMGRYQEKLIATEVDALLLQARLSASALAEGAVVVDEDEHNILSPLLARLMIRRLVEVDETRTRLFDLDDSLIADSRIILERTGKIQAVELPQEGESTIFMRALMSIFDGIDALIERQTFQTYDEDSKQNGDSYEIAHDAMSGEEQSQVWRLPKGGLLLTVAVPVQRYKQILGTIMLSRPDHKINASMHEVRVGILQIFGITLLITVLLSIYLARAIARPIRLLALAAEGVRHGQMRIVGLAGTASLLAQDAIPDFSSRKDEIGDLSSALRDMTSSLAKRIGAIENFAADVAHEIKNPLTSLRSAVETAELIKDPEMQKKLMLVIRDDVDRLDRLISDISNASRLDAELSRDEAVPLDMVRMLTTLVDYYRLPDFSADEEKRAEVVLSPFEQDSLKINGVEVRLVQVTQNLIANALSFSPPEGKVVVSAYQSNHYVITTVEDDGPGIPENKLEAIFDRFYTERPKAEKFGTHSGLGLSISKQIIEAHHGKIWAENRLDEAGKILGSRFCVSLPAL